MFLVCSPVLIFVEVYINMAAFFFFLKIFVLNINFSLVLPVPSITKARVILFDYNVGALSQIT